MKIIAVNAGSSSLKFQLLNMPQETELVSGVVESKSKKGNSIKVDGEWYGTFNASDLPAEWKDNVTFEYNMDKTGRYRNIVKGSVKVLDSAGASAVTGGGAAPRSNNMLGVELGHASNLAMRVTEQMPQGGPGLGAIGRRPVALAARNRPIKVELT